jgi:hypothetical protein
LGLTRFRSDEDFAVPLRVGQVVKGLTDPVEADLCGVTSMSPSAIARSEAANSSGL